jgi:hypothetical protein
LASALYEGGRQGEEGKDSRHLPHGIQPTVAHPRRLGDEADRDRCHQECQSHVDEEQSAPAQGPGQHSAQRWPSDCREPIGGRPNPYRSGLLGGFGEHGGMGIAAIFERSAKK